MQDFANQTPEILKEAERLTLKEVGEFQNQKDSDFEYVRGEFVYADFLARHKTIGHASCSDPISVEGVIYRQVFYPNGWESGKDTHISVGILRNKLAFQNLDTHDEVLFTLTMLHSSTRLKDFKEEHTNDWTGKTDP